MLDIRKDVDLYEHHPNSASTITPYTSSLAQLTLYACLLMGLPVRATAAKSAGHSRLSTPPFHLGEGEKHLERHPTIVLRHHLHDEAVNRQVLFAKPDCACTRGTRHHGAGPSYTVMHILSWHCAACRQDRWPFICGTARHTVALAEDALALGRFSKSCPSGKLLLLRSATSGWLTSGTG